MILLAALGTLGAGLKYLDESAKATLADRAAAARSGKPNDEGMLAAVNPFLPAPSPTPTPQLAKEYIYAGSRMLAVEDAGANAAPPADLAVWRPSSGYWYVMGGTGSQAVSVQWGLSGDKPAPGDYDGDGKTDFSVFRPSVNAWYIQRSSDQVLVSYSFGSAGDVTAPADYDGDGRTDAAVFRPSNGWWYIQRSSDAGLTALAFGLASDIPAAADFDGDGKADIAVWRNSDAKFYYLLSSQNNAAYQFIQFGQTGDVPVPADYDGDGRADASVWRADYTWHILYSASGTTDSSSFGDPNSDINVSNDYDGDGKVDQAFCRPANGTWYIKQSSKRGQPDYQREVQWGQSGDVPVPAFYRR